MARVFYINFSLYKYLFSVRKGMGFYPFHCFHAYLLDRYITSLQYYCIPHDMPDIPNRLVFSAPPILFFVGEEVI